MHVVKAEVLCFPVASNQVHHNVRVLDRLFDRVNVVQAVELEQRLAQVTDQTQAQRFVVIGTIRENQLGADFAELVGHIATQESGATEHRDDHAVETGPAACTAFQFAQIDRAQGSRSVRRGRTVLGLLAEYAQRTRLLFCNKKPLNPLFSWVSNLTIFIVVVRLFPAST